MMTTTTAVIGDAPPDEYHAPGATAPPARDPDERWRRAVRMAQRFFKRMKEANAAQEELRADYVALATELTKSRQRITLLEDENERTIEALAKEKTLRENAHRVSDRMRAKSQDYYHDYSELQAVLHHVRQELTRVGVLTGTATLVDAIRELAKRARTPEPAAQPAPRVLVEPGLIRSWVGGMSLLYHRAEMHEKRGEQAAADKHWARYNKAVGALLRYLDGHPETPADIISIGLADRDSAT